MSRIKTVLGVLFALVILISCQSQDMPSQTDEKPIESLSGAYPPADQIFDSTYPGPVTYVEEMSAFEAYQIAEMEAKSQNSEYVLYQVPATYIMEMNLGYPPTGEGWFFMFKDPNQPEEYYVYVYGGEVKGSTKAIPLTLDGDNPAEFLPLPALDQMLDSDEFMELFLKKEGEAYRQANPNAQFNVQLFFLKGNSMPIWSVYDVTVNSNQAMFSINALTGEEVVLTN